MNLHYDLVKAEIATHPRHAEHLRSAKHSRTNQRPTLTRRWQRFRSS
jgi:hypothetical protein